MDFRFTLLERNFSVAQGEVCVGGLPVSQIAGEFGTPIFIYDRAVLERKWRQLRATLPPEFSIYYSAKANPNRTILRFFLEQGAGIEVASAGESYLAVQAGCPPQKVIFAGPGKTDEELAYVISRGIGEIHAESLAEARRIAQISRGLAVRSPVSLRVNPSAQAQGGAMRMGGKPAPFGIDEEQLDQVIEYSAGQPALELRGIHIFAGTQILDHTILLDQYRKGFEIALRMGRQTGLPVRTLDFGGGLGIPYFDGDQELDMQAWHEGLLRLVDEFRGSAILRHTQFIVEPGRYLVGDCGTYVMRVTDVKTSRGKIFCICDGGMHHHLAASGNLGQTIKRNFPVVALNRVDRPWDQRVDVVGPLCTPLDVLGRSVQLPKTEIGDLIGVLQSGAYARSASPLGFLSHPTPAEVWIDQGRVSLIRRRGELADYERDLCATMAPAATVEAAELG